MKKEQPIMVRHGNNTRTPLLREEMLFTIKTQHKGGVRRAEREAETRYNKKLLPPFQEDDALIRYSPLFRRRRGERPRHSKQETPPPSPFSGGGGHGATISFTPPPFQEEEGAARCDCCLLPLFRRRRTRRDAFIVSSPISGGEG